MENNVIDVRNLFFSYGASPFLKDMTFSVKRGEIFGFLGPSGAGKSTLQKVLTGINRDYEGSAAIFGVESRNQKREFYERIGVDFEFPTIFEKLTARENLNYFAPLYSGERRCVDELLKDVGLLDHGDKKVSTFSKGMKSRLCFIKALIHNPELLFLDEPTSGLDPNNARVMKELILREKRRGTTIILTTHNMMDAQELCDRVAFIVEGEIKALDTPHSFMKGRGESRVKYTYMENGEEKSSETKLSSMGEDALLMKLFETNAITSIHSMEPNLNDIFIAVTGSRLDWDQRG